MAVNPMLASSWVWTPVRDGVGDDLAVPFVDDPDLRAVVDLEYRVTTAAGTGFDADAAASELPGLRAEEADLPVDHPAGDALHEAASLLAHRLRTTHPEIAYAAPKRTALQVIPGSWRHGYLPTRREQMQGGQRGRALTTDVPPGSPDPVLVPLPAGQALLMDVRLLHCSGSNTASWPRIGLNVRYVAPDAVHTRDGQPPAQLTPICGASW